MQWQQFLGKTAKPKVLSWRERDARTLLQFDASNTAGTACRACRKPVRLTLPTSRFRIRVGQAKKVGIRCSDCLQVYCLTCAYTHFGKRQPKWMRRAPQSRYL